MEPDFSGYATKAGLKCSDGRTIMPDAFKHQDTAQVPLVWMHGHNDPENVLGHAILENREDGVYCYGYFNKSPKAEHMRHALANRDITQMSIWANDLIERSKRVLHGAIREVSLVLSGANPGALIESVQISHGEDLIDVEDEAIIFTGLGLELSHSNDGGEETETSTEDANNSEDAENVTEEGEGESAEVVHADDDKTVSEVYNSMTDEQKEVTHYMIAAALEADGNGKEDDSVSQSDLKESYLNGYKEGIDTMKHNVFEDKKETESSSYTLSHSDITAIVEDARKGGSLKDAVESFTLSHGIESMDLLFPEAAALDRAPEFLKRRTEWVTKVLDDARKSPFSRIKTLSADLTVEEARAKGYIKGNLKKEEFFSISKRVTTPTTIYKKQKLDRDDIVDITDFDVVAWLKGEMRLMLDEEIARAILIGDGRDVASEDKINEQNIRPIAKDHELYVTTVTVNIDDASSSMSEFVDEVVTNRHHYKGTGLPTMFTTETYIAKFLLMKDTLGRRIYKSLDELASELRVEEIVPVEVMEEEADLVAIFVNMNDYVIGATGGGAVSMFDDFDIDYNQYKYLIETRMSGSLTKLKSAIVVRRTAGTNVLVTPNAPTFNSITNVVTVPAQTGVVYKDADTDTTLTAGAQAALDEGETLNVVATPASGYYFSSSAGDEWSFTNPE